MHWGEGKDSLFGREVGVIKKPDKWDSGAKDLPKTEAKAEEVKIYLSAAHNYCVEINVCQLFIFNTLGARLLRLWDSQIIFNTITIFVKKRWNDSTYAGGVGSEVFNTSTQRQLSVRK